MFYNFYNKNNAELITIKIIKDYQPDWGGNGIVFYVKNGKGILSSKYGYLENDSLATLVFGDIPLIKFHGDGPFFCPTCEKLVAAGYGMDMSDDRVISEMRDILNHKFVSIEQSLENLKPLLGLLTTGYYALVDTELCPTNGNGDFFWKLNNTPTYNKASCQIYGGDGHWSASLPYYILPTQPPNHYNAQQAEFYRCNNEYRAVAYHLEGYLCALLDGHHKAVAAAMNKKKVKTLVIIPATSVWETNKKQNTKGGISINGITVDEDELITPIAEIKDLWKSNQLTKEQTSKYLSLINNDFDNYEWPEEVLQVEHFFPDVMTVARIEWAGDISDERLDRVIKNKEALSDIDALNISVSLYYSESPRFKELAFHFCKNYSYVTVWNKIYELLANIRDDEVENFFVDYLIQYDKYHPDIKKIIDKYFM